MDPKDPLLGDLPRGISSHPGVSPHSTFIPSSAIAASQDLRYAPGKHFLGIIGGKPAETTYEGRRDPYLTGGTPIGIHDDRHFVLLAGTRSGKSRACILPVLLTYGGPEVDSGSVLVVDPKGELANLSSVRRSKYQQVFVFDPYCITTNGAEKFRAAFNPMDVLIDPVSDTRVEDAGLIADAIVMREERGTDPHWDESARMLLETLILHVATASKYEGERNLVTVYKKLSDIRGGTDDPVFEEMDINTAEDFAVIEGAHAFYDKADKERDSVLSSARRHARFLGYPQMKSVLSGASVDLRELKTKKTTIYLCLPTMRMGTCSRWLRMIVNSTLSMMEVEPAKPRYPVLLCLDEFHVMGRLDKVSESIAAAAGFGIRIMVVLQTLGQIQSLYKDNWETFLGNAGVIQCFGVSDLTSLKWISERMGQTMVKVDTQQAINPHERVEKGSFGVSASMNLQPLMAPEEISRYFARDDRLLRQLIIIPGLSPIILQRAFHDKHELFR